MNKIKELEYIPQIGLQNLRRFQKGFVCTCPNCGTKTPWKRKLYILVEGKQFITVFCQKCGLDTNLKNFIRMQNSLLYESYLAEERKELISDLKNGTLFRKESNLSQVNNVIDLKYKFNLNTKYFKPAKYHKESVEFCKERHITEHIDKFYYNVHPDHLLSGMLIFPFLLDDQSTLYGFQGRHCKEKKFNTFSTNESMKVYNIYNVDFDQTVFIFESIIDSLMINNAIAMLGTSISEPVMNLIKKRVFVFDNDRTGKKRAIQMLESGEKCLVYPDSFKYKDLNEAVKKGVSKSSLPSLINENIYEGIKGITKINFQLMKMKK